MSRQLKWAALCAGLACPAFAPHAQSNNNAIAVGSRIQFALGDAENPAPGPHRPMLLRGSVVGVRGDSIDVRIGSAPGATTMLRYTMADLSVSTGVERGWRSHPTRALLAGGIFVTSLYLLKQRHHDDQVVGTTSANTYLAGFNVGAAAGLFAQSTIRKTERWERITHLER